MKLFEYVNQRRQQGIERAATSAGDAWTREATAFVRRYLLNNPTLFVDNLWAAGLPRPTSKRALGSVLQQASRAGWMTKKTADTGETLALPSAASNGQLKAVWKSELYCEQSRCPEDGYELMDSPSDQVCPECDFRRIKIPPTFKTKP